MREAVTFEPPYTIVASPAGEPSPEKIQEVLNRTSELAEGKDNLCLLAKLTDLKNIPTKTREIVARGYPYSTYEKLAVFGASTRLRILGSLVLKTLQHVKEARFFTTEA